MSPNRIKLIYLGFKENPNRLDYSTKRLMKQYGANEQEVKEARSQYRQEIYFKNNYYVGVDPYESKLSDSTIIQDKPYRFQSLKEAAKSIGVDMDVPPEDSEEYLDVNKPGWKPKQTWVKSKEGSTLYVREESDDYIQEFQTFLTNYKLPDTSVFNSPTQPDPHPAGNKMAVVCMFDIHLGRIADLYYTGNVTNPLIQEDEYQREFTKLYSWLIKQDIEEILLPIGNDFFNVDDTRLTTTSGTPQDNTKNLSGAFALGLDLLCWTIDCLREKWPVKVVLVPGNHATNTEYMLASALRKIYTGVVEVDDRPIHRKYFKYGKNLIGLSHGELALNRYAELLPYECKDIFSSCDYFDILVGDKHKEETTKKVIDEFDGVVVRRLAALTRTDIWSYKMGFTLSKRRSYVLLYDKNNGLEIQYTNYAK